MDIGAYDGISLSNSYFFEKELGWTGICIEPIPSIYRLLTQNRSCICIEGCIAPQNGSAYFFQAPKSLEMLSGLVDRYDPRHVKRIRKEANLSNTPFSTFKVNCYNLNEILEKYNFYSIDYLSIDTEGGEYEILKSIDFDKFYIDVISVENNYDEDFDGLLLPLGYENVKALGCDFIYKKKQ